MEELSVSGPQGGVFLQGAGGVDWFTVTGGKTFMASGGSPCLGNTLIQFWE